MALIPGGVVRVYFPVWPGRRGGKVWSLASTQALIEVQLRLQLYKQLQWRLVLPVLQAELRVLQRRAIPESSSFMFVTYDSRKGSL